MSTTTLSHVEIIDAGRDLEDASTKILCKCNFCEKETVIYKGSKKILNNLTDPRHFYCVSCIRNDFHTKKNKNVLVMSYRAIIGYMYWSLYRIPFQPTMYIQELKDLIEVHRQIGLLNPVFFYDDESYCWFIDFGKVGEGKKKVPIEDVINTATEILTAFNLYQHIEGINANVLVKKYSDAIKAFYAGRVRPEGVKLLIPTLKGCNVLANIRISLIATNYATKPAPVEESRSFIPSYLVEKYKNDKDWV